MSHLTEKDLDHLAKLCRLELSTEDKEKLLPQLDNILAFVWQLQECDTSDIGINWIQWGYAPLHEWVICADMSSWLLKNVKHPITEHAIEITGKLKDT